MKSIAIFLLLAFPAGFQAAVLSEEPPPSNLEPTQTVLERVQDQIGEISTGLAETAKKQLDGMKDQVSEMLGDIAKKLNLSKLWTRRFIAYVRDTQQYGLSVYNQGKEAVGDQYNKAAGMVEEMKSNPTVVAVNEEVFEPLWKKFSKAASWLAEQSPYTMYNTMVKLKNKISP